MTRPWDDICWPGHRLHEALPALAQARGLWHRSVSIPAPVEEAGAADAAAWNRWLEDAASWIGLEAELVGAYYPDVEHMLAQASPAVLRLAGQGAPRFALLVAGGRKSVELLTPDLRRVRVPLQELHAELCRDEERPKEPVIHRLLSTARIAPSRQERVRSALLRHQLRGQWVGGCWLMRHPPGMSFGRQLVQQRLHVRLLAFVLTQIAVYAGWLLSWWMIGRSALSGQIDQGWVLGWAVLLMSLIPLRMLGVWMAGRLSTEGGGLLKQRLLAGALLLEPEEIRADGASKLFSRVLGTEAVESLAVGGGIQAIVALLELVFSFVILALGAGGWLHLLLLLGVLGLGTILAWRYARLRAEWTRLRLGLTHDLSERMLGHRTRLVQETLERWHQGEDQTLARYLDLSRRMDEQLALLTTLVPRGWLVLGLLGLLPALLAPTLSAGALAVAAGGILFSRQALQRACLGFSRLVDAVLAWREVALLSRAASRLSQERAPGALVAWARPPASGAPRTILEARGVSFRHEGRGRPVLQGLGLSLHEGERVLLEGPSGSGKSTLASLLAGVRVPSSGLLLCHGLDRATLGARDWRRHVILVPQFHENHLLTGSFGFNALMGRGWPASLTDLAEAEALCAELGLGGLLERMPGGTSQIIGETGWQLSHGEQSRLYIARALLQSPELVILDESFAALDPITLQRVMECVTRRVKTLILIAHP